MSGIYIPNMKMPKRCGKCGLRRYSRNKEGIMVAICSRLKREIPATNLDETKMIDCPLVEVPTHGRLIDASAEIERIKKMQEVLLDTEKEKKIYYEFDGIIDYLYDAPTIIEASK